MKKIFNCRFSMADWVCVSLLALGAVAGAQIPAAPPTPLVRQSSGNINEGFTLPSGKTITISGTFTWGGSSALIHGGTFVSGGTGAGFTIDLGASAVVGSLPALNFPVLTGDVTNTGLAMAIGANKVTSAMIVDGTIVGADISGSAAIPYSKLSLAGTITNGDLAGGIDLATKVTGILPALSFPTLTGDVTNTGLAMAIGANKVTSAMIVDGTIVGADISGSAAIPYSKLSLAGTITNGDLAGGIDLAAKVTGILPALSFPTLTGDVTNTGLAMAIGASKVTSAMIVDGTIVGADISGSAAIPYSKLSLAGTITNGDLAGSIDLTAKVTGILPATNGGTSNAFTAFTGPSGTIRTFTLPNNSSTLLYAGGPISGTTGDFSGVVTINSATLTATSGAPTLAAVGTNKSITLAPSGTGSVFNATGDLAGASGSGTNWGSYTAFGTSSLTGSAVGIGYNSTSGYGNIACITPGVAWRPLIVQVATGSGLGNASGFGIGFGGGAVTIGFNSSAVLPSNNAYSLGGASNVFTQIFVGQTGLKIGNGTNGPTITATGSSPNENLVLAAAGTGSVSLGGAPAAATTAAKLIKTVASIADNTATSVLTVTIPNAAHSANLHLTLNGSLGAGGVIGANEATGTATYDIAIARTAGVNAVATTSAAYGTASSSVAGAATIAVTAVPSAIAGAVGASNTFTVNVTIARGSGSSANHTCLVVAEIQNANATGITIL